KLQPVRGAHQAFELAAGVRRVRIQETPGARPDCDVAARVDADHAWRQNAADAVADEGHLFAIKHRNGGIGRTQIDADVERLFCHVSLLSLKQCTFVTTNLGKSKFAGLCAAIAQTPHCCGMRYLAYETSGLRYSMLGSRRLRCRDRMLPPHAGACRLSTAAAEGHWLPAALPNRLRHNDLWRRPHTTGRKP